MPVTEREALECGLCHYFDGVGNDRYKTGGSRMRVVTIVSCATLKRLYIIYSTLFFYTSPIITIFFLPILYIYILT